MTLDDRKSALLSAIIKEHVFSGQTVASKAIVDKYHIGFSPATIRNEMSDLEKEGFIYQPHTSAGRIPTEKGWKFYLENFIKDIELSSEDKQQLDRVFQEVGLTFEGTIKNAAKGLAALSRDAVFVGFSPDNFYYTGLSQLFRQPEFQRIDLVCHVSDVVDHFDEVISNFFKELSDGGDTKILVGEENPFGKDCGAIVSTYTARGDQHGVFGMVGPMRMNYENNLALIKYTKELLAQLPA